MPLGVTRDLTVAAVREQDDHLEVMFLESARFYKLPTANPGFERVADFLRNAAETRQVLRITLSSPDGDIIEDVQKPPAHTT